MYTMLLQPEDLEELSDEKGRKGSASKSKKSRSAAVLLSLDQRLEIVTAELDAVKKEARKFSAASASDLDALRVRLLSVFDSDHGNERTPFLPP